MVSQFVSTHAVKLLGDLPFTFPENTHAIGRLDNHSEGLLILTTDKRITRLLFLSQKPHIRTYLVMVQHKMTNESLEKLQAGVFIKIKNEEIYFAKPTKVKIIKNPLDYYAFATDYREQYAHTWLLITLTEGKFHQVRKMVLALRHRCQRLIRLSISNLHLNNLPPSAVKEFEQKDFFELLDLKNE